jgi:hypothetical protein
VYSGAELSAGIRLTLKKTPNAELAIYEKQPRRVLAIIHTAEGY